MSISRLDLPRIRKAIRKLRRTLHAANEAVAVAAFGEDVMLIPMGTRGAVETESYRQGLRIQTAADELLNLIMPPDAIAEAMLEQGHKAALIELREGLWRSGLGQTLAENHGEALLFLGCLESTLKTLEAAPDASEEPAEKPLARARPSDDFSFVHWYGTDYHFTGTQAACVRVLWRNWANKTPDVRQDTVLEDGEVEAGSKRLVDLFKGHPAWKTMIVKGTKKGTFRLSEPS